MPESVSLDNKKNIVGLSNVVISEIDDTIFVNTKLEVEDGIKGSLSFYVNDGQRIASTGENIKYDNITKQLYVSRLKVDELSSDDELFIPTLRVDNFTSKITVSNSIAFRSKFQEDRFPYKFRLWSDPQTNKESLLLITDDYENKKLRGALEINGDRFCFRQTINFLLSAPFTAVGFSGDRKGDLRIDENYVYVCCKDYDGTSKIWKRSPLLDW